MKPAPDETTQAASDPTLPLPTTTPRRTRKRKTHARLITKLKDLPVTLTLHEVCLIYRRGISTVRKELSAGIFKPAPFDVRPFRWLKEDVERDRKLRSIAANKAANAKIAAVTRAVRSMERDQRRRARA